MEKKRLQRSQEGDVVIHYEQKRQKDGTIIIEATKTEKDVVKAADKKQRRRDTNTKGKKFNMIRMGVQTKVMTETKSIVGKHKASEREKIVKQDKGQTFPNFSSSDMFYFESKTELKLVNKRSKTRYLKKFLQPGVEGEEEGVIDHQAFDIESLVEQDLGLSKTLIKKLNSDNVERLKKNS